VIFHRSSRKIKYWRGEDSTDPARCYVKWLRVNTSSIGLEWQAQHAFFKGLQWISKRGHQPGFLADGEYKNSHRIERENKKKSVLIVIQHSSDTLCPDLKTNARLHCKPKLCVCDMAGKEGTFVLLKTIVRVQRGQQTNPRTFYAHRKLYPSCSRSGCVSCPVCPHYNTCHTHLKFVHVFGSPTDKSRRLAYVHAAGNDSHSSHSVYACPGTREGSILFLFLILFWVAPVLEKISVGKRSLS
jgi:hypothetical protein